VIATHTPGPWVHSETDLWACATVASGRVIATCNPNDDQPKAVANARLIAAAPDLHAALEALLDVADRIASGFPPPVEYWFAARDMARAALDKVRGEP